MDEERDQELTGWPIASTSHSAAVVDKPSRVSRERVGSLLVRTDRIERAERHEAQTNRVAVTTTGLPMHKVMMVA